MANLDLEGVEFMQTGEHSLWLGSRQWGANIADIDLQDLLAWMAERWPELMCCAVLEESPATCRHVLATRDTGRRPCTWCGGSGVAVQYGDNIRVLCTRCKGKGKL